MRQLHRKLAEKGEVKILVIEQREPHCGRMAFADIEQPSTFEERRALAQKCKEELELPMIFLVDGMDDSSRALFGELPSPAFIVDADGVLRDKLPWAEAGLIEKSLAELDASPASASSDPTRLDRAVAEARRALASNDHAAAAASLEKSLAKAANETPSRVAEARLALALLLHANGAPEAEAAIESAATAAARAWSKDPARHVAALTELALLEAPPQQSVPRWKAALEALEPRAPTALRSWIAGKLVQAQAVVER